MKFLASLDRFIFVIFLDVIVFILILAAALFGQTGGGIQWWIGLL